ncbi:MAG: FAD:protein FMN transferase [Lachnospiraceae bacterium]|nr:FAD:protein FMN transferase [Lachnospiraceae bacterium]
MKPVRKTGIKTDRSAFDLRIPLSNRQRPVLLLVLAALLGMLLGGCGKQDAIPYSKTDFYFDTVVTLTVYDSPGHESEANALLEAGMQALSDYEKLLSPTVEGSDLYRINHAQGEWTEVSPETATLLYSALSFCKSSGGQIDITLAPVIELWDFHEEGSNAALPPANRLKKALSHVDYQSVSVDGNRVRLEDPEAAIDLGFIAKGYIADQIKSLFLEKGVANAIINLGGNVQTIGAKPDHSGFSVGIQRPFADLGDYVTTVTLSDAKDAPCTAATSGTYERCFQIGDSLYHHILDPATGMPVKTDLSSVTILAGNSMEADALSTACLILGCEKAKAYIESLPDIHAVLITADGDVIRVD